MRSLVALASLSLDGVMQAPGAPEEDRAGGFSHGGWSVGYWDDMMGELATRGLSARFDLLLGRKTYEIFAAHWPYVSDDPIADALNNAAKYVVSTSLTRAEWNNSTIIGADLVADVTRLKQQDGPEIQVHGSSQLIQTLLANNLIDELRLWIFPVVLGGGKRLFGDGARPAGFQLVDAKTSGTGVLIATYRQAGEIRYGSFALEEPTEAELARRRRIADE